MSATRYVVCGAGAVGGILGGKLHESGCDVVLVARGAHFDAIRDSGLVLQEPDGSRTVHRIPVVERIADAELTAGDVVFHCMKSQDTEQSLRELAAAAPEEIAVSQLSSQEVISRGA